MSFWFTGFYLPSGRSQFWGNTRWQLFEEIKFSDTLKIFAAFSSFSSNVAPPDVMTERGEQLISLAENRGEQLKRWSNHRESDVVWQSRPNGGREKNHTKKSFHRLVVAISKSWREDFFFHIWPPMFTTNRKCQDATRQRTKRGGNRSSAVINSFPFPFARFIPNSETLSTLSGSSSTPQSIVPVFTVIKSSRGRDTIKGPSLLVRRGLDWKESRALILVTFLKDDWDQTLHHLSGKKKGPKKKHRALKGQNSDCMCVCFFKRLAPSWDINDVRWVLKKKNVHWVISGDEKWLPKSLFQRSQGLALMTIVNTEWKANYDGAVALHFLNKWKWSN